MANTIQDKLTYLNGTKDAIKQAIIEKGVEVTDTDTFRSYANKIKTIQSGGSIAGAPSGIKFAYSIFTTVPTEIIPYLETQNSMYNMFNNCINLQTVPLFDTSKVTNMSYMFNSCISLQTVPLFDTSKVTYMSYMFNSCQNLTTVPLFDTSKVTYMSGMFSYCSSLTSVPQFDTSNVTDMSYMFSSCQNLTTVPLFDTSKVNNMGGMFNECTSLTSIPLLNVSNVTDMNDIFYECSSLTNLGGFTGLKQDLELSYSSLITVDSVMNVINYAADMTSEPKTLGLSQDVFDKLSEEQIATATAKGWNIAAA